MSENKRDDPFKPQQPQIPGVAAKVEPKPEPAVPASFPNGAPEDEPLPIWVTVAAVAFLVLVVGFGWWAVASPHRAKTAAAQDTTAVDSADDSSAATYGSNMPSSPPGAIASVGEMERPWSARRFLFNGPAAKVPAMAVKLPDGGYWGFALKEPYGDCKLEFVTDIQKLASKYHYAANHPMVADPCTLAVYDLAQYGNAPSGLVRGLIVQGTGLRPPLAIEVTARGNEVVAVRME